METILQLENVSRSYPDFRLENITFKLPKGTIMGFIGENGSGKTTTLKLILNLITLEQGSITVFEKDYYVKEQEIKQEVSVILGDLSFYQALRINDIKKIMVGMQSNFKTTIFDSYLKRLNVPQNKSVKELSKGMKMKVAIALALAHQPKLLLLDEPTSGLDPIVRNEILEIFRDFVSDGEHSILFSSHITTDIEAVADYVTFIHHGKILFIEEKDRLLETHKIAKLTKEQFERLNLEDVINYTSYAYGYTALIKNTQAFQRKYPEVLVESCSLEQIMVYYVRGEE